MFDQIMHLKMLKQNTSEKNLSLGTQVAKLEANVEKLCYQLRQKKVQEHNLRKAFLVQKKELHTLEKTSALNSKMS